MKKITFLMILTAFAVLTLNVSAQKGKPMPSPTPNPYVKAEFLNVGSDNITQNRVTMDLAAPYEHNIDGVSAQFFIGGSRDLVINLITSQRSVWYDFSEEANESNPHPAWWENSKQQNVKPHFNVLRAYYAKENCQPDSNGIYDCSEVTGMNGGGWSLPGDNTSYRLQWNPGSIQPHINSPEETSPVKVNYYKGLDGQEVYTITPLPNSDSGRIINGLQSEKTVKGKTVASPAGQYVMPFTLIVRPK